VTSRPVLVCGIPSESCVTAVLRELTSLDVPTVLVNQRQFCQHRLSIEHASGRLRGTLLSPHGLHYLDGFGAVYLRLMDFRYLPELEKESTSSGLFDHARQFHECVDAFASVATCRVVNLPAATLSNSSKPYQLQILRKVGFHIPATLVTDEPELVEDFVRQQGPVIYKSVSSVRSVVRLFRQHDMRRLPTIRSCPTQFQQYIDGFDLRVHTIGARWVATAIRTKAVDYRYAHRDGWSVRMQNSASMPELGEQCVRAANCLGLAVAGFDFRVSRSGVPYCLEVNPMPVFTYYEARSGQRISRIVAEYLAGRS
jgi:hypothetical protein